MIPPNFGPISRDMSSLRRRARASWLSLQLSSGVVIDVSDQPAGPKAGQLVGAGATYIYIYI